MVVNVMEEVDTFMQRQFSLVFETNAQEQTNTYLHGIGT